MKSATLSAVIRAPVSAVQALAGSQTMARLGHFQLTRPGLQTQTGPGPEQDHAVQTYTEQHINAHMRSAAVMYSPA